MGELRLQLRIGSQAPGKIGNQPPGCPLAAQRSRAVARTAASSRRGDRPQPVAGQVVERISGSGPTRGPELPQQPAKLLFGLAVQDRCVPVPLEMAERVPACCSTCTDEIFSKHMLRREPQF